MAGSFDTIRSAIVSFVETADQETSALPLYSIEATIEETVEETPAQSAQAEVDDSLFSTSILPVPGEGPVHLPDETPSETPNPSAQSAEHSTEPPAEPPAEPSTVPSTEPSYSSPSSRKFVIVSLCQVMSISERLSESISESVCMAIERLHSLLSLLQSANQPSLAAFTDYFYTQINQTLLWAVAVPLSTTHSPHSLLCDPSSLLRATSHAHLHDMLIQQIPPLRLEPRSLLALVASCRTIGRSEVKKVVQTLMDYTPEDPSIDSERLIDSLQVTEIVQTCSETSLALLRSYCLIEADHCTDEWMKEVLNGEEMKVANAMILVVRRLYSTLQDCNALFNETPTKINDPSPITFQCVKEEPSEEMYAYIEKTMASRAKVLPVELKATAHDVVMGLLRTFLKNVQEEIRVNVLFDYQLHKVVVNLAFLFSMVSCVLEDPKELREVVDSVIRSAYERCYEPTDMAEEEQKSAIEDGIVEFMMAVSEFFVCFKKTYIFDELVLIKWPS